MYNTRYHSKQKNGLLTRSKGIILAFVLVFGWTAHGFTQEAESTGSASENLETSVSQENGEGVIMDDVFTPLFAFGLEGGYFLNLNPLDRDRFQDGPITYFHFQYFPQAFKDKSFLKHLSFLLDIGYKYSRFTDVQRANWNTFSANLGARLEKTIWQDMYLFGSLSAGYYLDFYKANTLSEDDSLIINGLCAHAALGIGYIIADRFDLSLKVNYRADLDRKFMDYMSQMAFASVAFSTRFEKPMPSVTIEKIDIQNLFAPLYQYYSQQDVVHIQLLNDSGVDLSQLKVSVMIPKYMESPTQSNTIEQFTDGATESIAMPIVLGENVLTLTNTEPVNVQIKVDYMYKSKSFDTSAFQQITLYHRNAMTWDDDQKLASFITTLDPMVSSFARRMLNSVANLDSKGVSSVIVDAMTIFEGLGEYGMSYIPDPSSPTVGNSAAVDYIQYPRDILKDKTGDCDDLTVLFCTLLESVGIQTAFVTVPGHIFIMFNTKVPEDEYELIAKDVQSIYFYEGTVWVPLEVTAVSREDFNIAWQWASDQLKRWAGIEGMNVFPTVHAQAKYPAVTLPAKEEQFDIPSVNNLSRRITMQIPTLIELADIQTLEALLAQLEEDPDNTDLLVEVGLAYMNQKGGADITVAEGDTRASAIEGGAEAYYLRKAEETFKKILELDSSNYDALKNLCLTYVKMEDYNQAQEVLNQCMMMRPADTSLYMIMSVIQENMGF